MPEIETDHSTLDGIVEIDYPTLDAIVEVGLRDLLNSMVEGYRNPTTHPDDKKEYLRDIQAIERVLKIYSV